MNLPAHLDYNTDLSTGDAIEVHREEGWSNLKPMFKVFCFEHLKDYNHLRAAKAAGIPRSEALQTLRNPLVQAFLADLIEDRRVSTSITSDYVATMWMSLLPKLMGDEEVAMVTAAGQHMTAKKFFSSESVAALREMGKSTKFYEDGSGQGMTLNLSLAINDNMTPQQASEEYMRMINGEVVSEQ